jgi:hypothetical protein
MISEELVGILDNAPVAYYVKGIPHPFDGKISNFISTFCNLDDEEKGNVLVCITGKARGTLMSFADRMASLGLNTQSEQAIYEGIIATGISINFSNWESVNYHGRLSLTMLHHSASLLDLDFSNLVQKAKSCIGLQATSYINEFLRDPLTLEQMSIVTLHDNKGFRYKQIQ